MACQARHDLNKANAVGHIKSVLVRSEADEGLLLTVRADERVHASSLDIVRLFEGSLNLTLVRVTVNNENKRVHILDLLHGALRGQRVQERLAGIRARQVRSALTRVFRVARQAERLGAVERRRRADLAHTRLTRATLLDDLLGDVRLPRSQVLLVWFAVSILSNRMIVLHELRISI